jgi:glycosyltransferase involved in cell wall biosynthesis
MTPKISIAIPFHFGMKNWQFFLTNCLESIEKQAFTDYEVILIKHSTMPITSNRVIESAKGEIIKVLYVDDWLESDNYLEKLYEAFLDKKVDWVITSASTNKEPKWIDDIHTGNNKLGSPSALAFRNRLGKNVFFDERLSWMLDCDLYKRLEKRFGKPKILIDIEVGIGVGNHQMTYLLTDEQKLEEINYLKQKYG